MGRIFKSKMSCTRFKGLQEHQEIIEEDFLKDVQRFSFRADNTLELVTGFADVENPYAENKDAAFNGLVKDGKATLLFRIDKKSIPSSAVERETNKRIEKLKFDRELTYCSRDQKNDCKEQAKLFLISTTPFNTKFIPVIYDLKTGQGFFFSTSNKDFEEFEGIFSQMVGASQEQTILMDDATGFLTWLWWRAESNTMKDVQTSKMGYSVFIGDCVSVSKLEEGSSVKAKDSIEEARLAISNGSDVSRIDLVFNGAEEPITFALDLQGKIYGLKYSKIDVKEGGWEFLLIEETKEVFSVVDALVSEYAEALANGNVVTPQVRNTWARGDFCTRHFEDV